MRWVQLCGCLNILGEGTGNPLHYSCLENSMDIGAWQATVHGFTRSWTWLSDYHFIISEDFETLTSISLNLFPDTKFNFWILIQITTTLHKGFLGGSKSKDFACNTGYPSSILGLEVPLENEMVSTPAFLPGEFHGQGSLVGYGPWVAKSRTWLND